jgi:hypothetical protein
MTTGAAPCLAGAKLSAGTLSSYAVARPVIGPWWPWAEAGSEDAAVAMRADPDKMIVKQLRRIVFLESLTARMMPP